MQTDNLSHIGRYEEVYGKFDRKDVRDLSRYKLWFSLNTGDRYECVHCGKQYQNRKHQNREIKLCSRECYFDNISNQIGKESLNTKRCSKCNDLMSYLRFSKDSSKKDGLYPSCKECVSKTNGCILSEIKMRIDSGGYPCYRGVRVHRYKYQAFIGRELKRKEHIHHKNGNKKDYRLSNLEILTDSEHHKLHYESMDKKPQEYLVEQDRDCVICGSCFKSFSYRAKYCSPTCRYKSRKTYLKKWKNAKNK